MALEAAEIQVLGQGSMPGRTGWTVYYIRGIITKQVNNNKYILMNYVIVKPNQE